MNLYYKNNKLKKNISNKVDNSIWCCRLADNDGPVAASDRLCTRHLQHFDVLQHIGEIDFALRQDHQPDDHDLSGVHCTRHSPAALGTEPRRPRSPPQAVRRTQRRVPASVQTRQGQAEGDARRTPV